ncbi:type IV pilin protein, partial [Phascolarctobacterium sp.]|uniref:type IV pilin protein n=1 Tax=Phascolarctobacterium sp. TaxID=2049039 RepID=UPI00386D1C6E
MKFKKNWKRFWTLDRHHAEGFTLVELIVVIAILAILGGVAVPAYSGYVKKANMAADQTLVSEVANALVLQYYTTPGFEGVAAVALTDNGAFAGEGDTFADAAMTAVFGDSWDTQGNLALSYNDWAKGAEATQKVLNYFGSVSSDNPLYGIYNGTDIPSFAEDVDDLFVLIKDTAMSVAGENGSGAELIQGASNLTVNNTQNVDSSKFAEYWAGNTWNSNFLMGDSTYDASVSELDNGDLLNSAVANAAVIKARNTSVATYLRNQGYSEEVYNLFANYTYGSNSIVPKDVTIEFFGESDADTNPEFGAALEKVMTETEAANIQNDLMTYFGVTIDDSGNPVKTLEGSQAY